MLELMLREFKMFGVVWNKSTVQQYINNGMSNITVDKNGIPAFLVRLSLYGYDASIEIYSISKINHNKICKITLTESYK